MTAHRFDVTQLPPAEQLLAWRERVGQIVDVVVSRANVQRPFHAWVDRYMVGEYVFINCYSDAVTLDRSIARISRDNARSMVFHLFLDGEPATTFNRPSRRDVAPADLSIVAVDLDQPFRINRKYSAHVEIFMPLSRLQNSFPEPDILHGRGLLPNTPGVALIMERVKALTRTIGFLNEAEVHVRLDEIVNLIANAYGKALGLRECAHALTREMTINNARRMVREHLFDSDLTPERVLESLGVSRASVYRLFEHEGGLASYIRDLRLRAAANDLVRRPDLAVKDIAYSVGFKSATDFSRAFRRAYDTTPQALRDYDAWYIPDGSSEATPHVAPATERAEFEMPKPSAGRVYRVPLPGLAILRRA